MVTDMLNLSSKGLSIHTTPETPRHKSKHPRMGCM